MCFRCLGWGLFCVYVSPLPLAGLWDLSVISLWDLAQHYCQASSLPDCCLPEFGRSLVWSISGQGELALNLGFLHVLYQELTTHGLQAKSGLPPAFVSRILCGHNHNHLFMCCLCLLSCYKSRILYLGKRLKYLLFGPFWTNLVVVKKICWFLFFPIFLFFLFFNLFL